MCHLAAGMGRIEGAKVVLAAWRRDKGEEVLREIEAAGGEGLFVRTDVNNTADVKALVAAAIERFGGLDGAFNNAGVTGPTLTPLADIDEAGWDEALNTNLRAVFVCMKYQIPALLARGGGAIVNMSSMYGLKPSDLGHLPRTTPDAKSRKSPKNSRSSERGPHERYDNAAARHRVYRLSYEGDHGDVRLLALAAWIEVGARVARRRA